MCTLKEREKMSQLRRKQHVFLITNGPQVVATGVDGIKRVHHRRTEQLIDSAAQSGRPIKFSVMPGWLCPNVRDLQGRLEIQPQLLTPIHILVKIFDWGEELGYGSPRGVALFGEIKYVARYQGQLPEEDNQAPILRIHDLLYISYHPDQCIGGLTTLGNANDIRSGRSKMKELDAAQPIVNSLSQLQREYICRAGTASRRGCSIYKIAGTSTDFPIDHQLLLHID